MSEAFILIAEDDADDRFLLQTAFEEKGYSDKLEFVENGMELIAYLDARQLINNNHYPKFILLDLNMPKKDGREVLKELKQHSLYKKIPIIIFTTTKNENEIRRCYEMGANTYVIKPASFNDLLNTIEQIRNYWLDTASIVVNLFDKLCSLNFPGHFFNNILQIRHAGFYFRGRKM
ncbi:response regulator [soil metagenome]